MMLCLHLFNRDFHGLFQPLFFIGNHPLSYFISLFSDACVPIFAFGSGYGIYFSYSNNKEIYLQKNKERTKKLFFRYWIILILFAVLLGWLLNKEGYPGSWQKFALNVTGLKPSYNGAWWFFTTYILFVFTSIFWFKLLDRVNPYLCFFGLLLLYLVAFYFRVYNFNLFENGFLHWLHSQSVLYFCTLLQFMTGAFALQYKWHKKVTNFFAIVKYKNALTFLGIVLLIVFHAIIPNLVIAPFTAVGFIFLFLQMDFGTIIEKSLDFSHLTRPIYALSICFYI